MPCRAELFGMAVARATSAALACWPPLSPVAYYARSMLRPAANGAARPCHNLHLAKRGGGSAERRSVRALPAQCAGRTALRAVASGTRGTLLREASAPLTFRDARLSALHRGIFPFVRASLASEEKTSAAAGWAAAAHAPDRTRPPNSRGCPARCRRPTALPARCLRGCAPALRGQAECHLSRYRQAHGSPRRAQCRTAASARATRPGD